LRSRAAPCEDDYLKIKPGKSQSTEIEINEAYPIKKKGVYSLSYSGYGRTAFSEEIRFEVE